MRSKKTTVREIQKLTGLLNFFCRAVVPGRAFTRRMYAKVGNLQPHHHVRVDRELRMDCTMWSEFLVMDQAVCRPFLDFLQVLHADQLDFHCDAALDAKRLGVGGRFGDEWFAGELILRHLDCDVSRLNIQIAELDSIFLALSLWMDKLCNPRVVLFTDNESVMHMINKSTSGCSICMRMIRIITLWSLRLNVRVFCSHIGTKQNTSADLLSRGKINHFLAFQKKCGNPARQQLLPEDYWPIPNNWFS